MFDLTWPLLVVAQGYEPPVLVFVQTKERAKELFRELIYDNITVDTIHADRTQKQVGVHCLLSTLTFHSPRITEHLHIKKIINYSIR